MKLYLGIVLLAASVLAYPSYVNCDYSTPSDGDIRTASSVGKMNNAAFASPDPDCISVSPAAPNVGDTISVTVSCGLSGYRGLFHITHKGDASASNLLSGSGTSKCSGNRQDSDNFNGDVQFTFTPQEAATYELVAVTGSYSGFRRQVLDVVVAAADPSTETDLVDDVTLMSDCLTVHLADDNPPLDNYQGFQFIKVYDLKTCNVRDLIASVGLQNGQDYRGKDFCVSRTSGGIEEWNGSSELGIDVEYSTLSGEKITTSETFCPAGTTCTCTPEEDGCICTTEYDPVCGDDGKTYSNACELTCASGVKQQSEGSCNSAAQYSIFILLLSTLLVLFA